jgi:transposase
LGLEVPTSVVNPLSVKRFIHMRLGKVKTDRSDAHQIREYAMVNDVPLYRGRTPRQAERLQLSRYLDVTATDDQPQLREDGTKSSVPF